MFSPFQKKFSSGMDRCLRGLATNPTNVSIDNIIVPFATGQKSAGPGSIKISFENTFVKLFQDNGDGSYSLFVTYN